MSDSTYLLIITAAFVVFVGGGALAGHFAGGPKGSISSRVGSGILCALIILGLAFMVRSYSEPDEEPRRPPASTVDA